MTRRLISRTPLRALLRRPHGRHRAHKFHTAPERIECRHGLMRCDHCSYRPGVATRTALMTPTLLMKTVERVR